MNVRNEIPGSSYKILNKLNWPFNIEIIGEKNEEL